MIRAGLSDPVPPPWGGRGAACALALLAVFLALPARAQIIDEPDPMVILKSSYKQWLKAHPHENPNAKLCAMPGYFETAFGGGAPVMTDWTIDAISQMFVVDVSPADSVPDCQGVVVIPVGVDEHDLHTESSAPPLDPCGESIGCAMYVSLACNSGAAGNGTHYVAWLAAGQIHTTVDGWRFCQGGCTSSPYGEVEASITIPCDYHPAPPWALIPVHPHCPDNVDCQF